MNERVIYVLHEYGSDNHYNGLVALGKQRGFSVVFREFRIFHLIGSGLEHRNFHRIMKQFVNFVFLVGLIFTKRKRVVLGMHPFDWRLIVLNFILRNHIVYYHTSFTMWNPNDSEKYAGISSNRISRIRRFICQKVEHVFAVTERAKKSLLSQISCPENKISVVFHSYKVKLQEGNFPDRNQFIYVGRMDWDKGIVEICEYFERHPELIVTLIGNGDNVSYVREMSKKCSNVKYVEFVKGADKLRPFYNNAAYFILNSKKTNEWEELFGQVLIESMACGCVPVAVNHSGPKEIVKNGENGILFDEDDFVNTMNRVCLIGEDEYKILRHGSILRGRDFYCEKIANRWKPVLGVSHA